MTCAACRRSLRSRRADARYCSAGCKQRAYRQRLSVTLPDGGPLRLHQHDWYTPPVYVEAVRRVLGGIDLDPASCDAANGVVRAERFYTEEDNGLDQPWTGRVYLNPPYCGEQRVWIEKLLEEYTAGNVTAAILLVPVSTDAAYFQPLSEVGTICFTKGRVSFWHPERGKGGTARTGSAFVYLGPDPRRFAEEFGRYGRVVKAVR